MLAGMNKPSLPLRVLLATGESVTQVLEDCFQSPVVVETHANEVAGGCLHRTAVLRLASDGRPLLRAASELELYALPGAARRALMAGKQPIGTVLREAGVETRREIAPYRADRATAEEASDLGVHPGAPLFERTYRILSGARRLATITERIPAALFEAPAR
jgi:chorismate-pyruvate lyase